MVGGAALAGFGDAALGSAEGIALCITVTVMAGDVAVEQVPLAQIALANDSE
jgi:hypothetical protein